MGEIQLILVTSGMMYTYNSHVSMVTFRYKGHCSAGYSECEVYTPTDKKENKIFLMYKEILNGEVAKSYMRKGFLIYDEIRKYLTIYEEADI